VVLEELVGSGVLSREGATLSFFRSSFRDFFAAHHLHQIGQLDTFVADQLFDRRWGGVVVFAAGLRRNNSRLLSSVAGSVSRRKANAVDSRPGDDYYYGAYVCGRILANSESADHLPKIEALRTTLHAVNDSLPELTEQATAQYGNIGHLMALIASEHSLFVTVGVPWIRNQLSELLGEAALTDEERYFLASTYTNLGYDDCYAVLEQAIRDTDSTKVLVILQVMLWQLEKSRKVHGDEKLVLDRLRQIVERRLGRRKEEVRSLWDMKSEALKIERERMRRLHNKARREGGGLE
jgi:hypothetical protein